ncbi:MAG: Protease synthase and sporulation negative regulatory protein PAI 1 [Microgenomates bacterium OLB22]|nr:MAG: Protease synthase and sporulation negative regulatory protein PAI 1 [Microgenomates bacterium OLB22]
MDDITVRPALPKDAQQIAKIHVRTWQHAYKGQIPDDYLASLSIARRKKRWEKILAAPIPGTRTFVAGQDGEVIGFCSVGPCRDNDMDSKTGEIWSIYIDPDHMKHGAGSALLKEGCNYLRERRYKKATLWVLDTNEKTRRWYEKRDGNLRELLKQIIETDLSYISCGIKSCSNFLRGHMAKLDISIKNDRYKKVRGGSSRILDISCASCGEHLCFYQKDGPGILKRMYLDRINGLTFQSTDILGDIPQLTCPNCQRHLGTPIIFEKEDRLAYRLFVGAVSKKISK